jgi:UDP-galactopyranose mutase
VYTLARPKQTKENNRPVVVIGAGPTGLSAAYHLGEDALLIEQNDTVGGWCRSIEDGGFTFDYAGHIMFSKEEYVHKLYEMLLGDNVHWQDREAWIFSKGVYTRYPFQGALYGLPPEVIKECILGAIEARFGSLEPASNNGHSNGNGLSQPSANGNGHRHANGNGNGLGSTKLLYGDLKEPVDCCADGVIDSFNGQDGASCEVNYTGEPRNFEEFIYKVWGKGIGKHFAIPYNKKLWAVPLNEMETSWLGGRVPLPDLGEIIEGALSPVPKPMGPNARFGYPLRGGFQALMDGFLPHLKGELHLSSSVAAVSPSRHTVTLDDGTEVAYEQLISTMALPTLVKLIGKEAPAEVRAAAEGLRHVSVRCVNLGIGRENLTEKHWIYYPEETVFHRIFVQGNASPHCNAPGGFGLTCEITYSEHKPLPCDGDELIKRCIEDCHKVGIFNEDDPVWVANQVDMPYAYVVYDHARPHNVAVIRDWLATKDIVLSGRYSEWEYYNSDHAFTAGKAAADAVMEKRAVAEAALNSALVSSSSTGTGASLGAGA